MVMVVVVAAAITAASSSHSKLGRAKFKKTTIILVLHMSVLTIKPQQKESKEALIYSLRWYWKSWCGWNEKAKKRNRDFQLAKWEKCFCDCVLFKESTDFCSYCSFSMYTIQQHHSKRYTNFCAKVISLLGLYLQSDRIDICYISYHNFWSLLSNFVYKCLCVRVHEIWLRKHLLSAFNS